MAGAPRPGLRSSPPRAVEATTALCGRPLCGFPCHDGLESRRDLKAQHEHRCPCCHIPTLNRCRDVDGTLLEQRPGCRGLGQPLSCFPPARHPRTSPERASPLTTRSAGPRSLRPGSRPLGTGARTARRRPSRRGSGRTSCSPDPRPRSHPLTARAINPARPGSQRAPPSPAIGQLACRSQECGRRPGSADQRLHDFLVVPLLNRQHRATQGPAPGLVIAAPVVPVEHPAIVRIALQVQRGALKPPRESPYVTVPLVAEEGPPASPDLPACGGQLRPHCRRAPIVAFALA
jgi:hypothetical protein